MAALGIIHSESAASFGAAGQRSQDKSVVLPSIYGGSIHTTSSSNLPSLALLFPDTAPRPQWRPQVEAWIRKARLNHGHHPYARMKSNNIDDVAGPYLRSNNTNQYKDLSDNQQQYQSSSSLSITGAAAALTSISSSALPATTTSTKIRANPDITRNDKSLSCSSSDDNTKRKSPPNKSARSPSRSPSSKSVGRQSPTTTTSSRRCISCGCDQSPCWRPSWSPRAGQLCNSCGLRYKKTGARCISSDCGRIPAKGEWISMKASQVHGQYMCFYCGGPVAVGESSSSSSQNVHHHNQHQQSTSSGYAKLAAAVAVSPFGDNARTQQQQQQQLESPAIPPIGNQMTQTAIRS